MTTIKVDSANAVGFGHADRPQQPDDHALWQAEAADRDGQQHQEQAQRHEQEVVGRLDRERQSPPEAIPLGDADELYEHRQSEDHGQRSAIPPVRSEGVAEAQKSVPPPCRLPALGHQRARKPIRPQGRQGDPDRESGDEEHPALERSVDMLRPAGEADCAEPDKGDEPQEAVHSDRRDCLTPLGGAGGNRIRPCGIGADPGRQEAPHEGTDQEDPHGASGGQADSARPQEQNPS